MALKKGMYNINGAERIVISDYEKDTLADALRRIGLTSVKVGCGVGQCGTCTVLIDGKPVRACTKKFSKIPEHTNIETLEAIGTAANLHPLQQAWITYGGVQCGFCTPGFIMSAKALLAENPAPTRQDVRDWFTKNNNLCRCTGYKPLVDAVMAAAAVMRGEKTMADITYQMPEDGRIYNTNYPRPDALAKVLGVADYGDDIALKMPQGTLHMGVTWAAHHHANIKGIDTSEAEKMPGVVAVVTHKDIKGTNNLGAPMTAKMTIATQVKEQVLCADKVRRIGEPIAIVVADTDEHAREAAKFVKVDYEVLPFYSNYLEAIKGDVSIDGETPTNEVFRQPVFKGEDTREIFANAEEKGLNVVEGSFFASREPHLMLEPWSLQAYYDEDGLLTVNYKSQTLWAGMASVPKALGIKPEEFRIIEIPSGASFGASMDPHGVAMIAAAEMVVKKPITWTQTYAETQRFTGKRATSYTNAKLACDNDGKIVALEFDCAIDHGGNNNSAGNLQKKVVRFIGYPYNVPNLRGLARGGMSNQPFGVAYRAYGSPQCYISSEQLIDMMAEKLGMDPLEIRYKNVAVEGDLTNNSYPFKVYGIKDMIDYMRPYYEESVAWAKEPSENPGWKRGVGVACGGYHVSTPADRAEIDIELMPDGSIRQYNCWEAMGQGASVGTLVHMHEAFREALNLPIEKIQLYQNDTKFCPATGPASGSRSHFMAGNATLLAAKDLLDAMRKEDGTYRTYDEMVAEGIPTKYRGCFSTIGTLKPIDDYTGIGDPMPDNNYLVVVARVEVEEATGKTKVVAVHSRTDVGVVGNFMAVEGQAYGGMAHSIGFAISEDYYDEVKKCATPLGCGFPKCNDIPDDFEFTYQQQPRKNGPHGSGGASESFQSCGHVAIINAINNAVGVRIHEIPATPEKVKAAMEAKTAGKDYAPEKYFLGEDWGKLMDHAWEMSRKTA